MLLRGTVTDPITGNPAPDGGPVIEVRRRDTNALITTLTTTNGEYQYVTDGNPGPFVVTHSYGGEVKKTTSWAVGPASAADISGLPLYFRLFQDGYIQGVWNNLAVSAPGSGMTVNVASGAAVANGIIYDQRTNPKSVTIPAADGSNPRIDTLVVRVIPAGATNEGTSNLAVISGTPAASPVAAALTQSATVWEIPLADIRVNAGVTAIASGNITDRRSPAAPALNAEAVQDLVAALIVAGANISVTYDDPGNTLTIASTLDTEAIQDMIASFVLVGPGVTKTYDDTANTLTLAADNEALQDMIAGFLVAGIRTQIVYDDPGNKLTISHPAPFDGTALSGTVTLSASGGPFTTQTISGLVASKTYRIKARASCRGYGDSGVTGEGTLHTIIGGTAGPESMYLQYDQGVDSTGPAAQVRDITGATSVTVAWGWTHSSGVLTVRGTLLEWHVEQLN